MNDKVKEALETLANIVFPTGTYDFVDDSVEVRLRGKEGEYLSIILGAKMKDRLQKGK